MTGRVGVDVGGTFTDLVWTAAGEVHTAKVPSTPSDQAEGILAALERAGADPSALGRFAHGTTVATNTVLERDGARVVLVTTSGFRDVLTIGRQARPSLYDLTARRPPPLVHAVVEAAERVGADGAVVQTLADDEVDRVVAAVVDAEPEAVAICLLFCFLDPTHEERLARAVVDALPDVVVSTSSQVLPVFREYERASTTALNAAVAPRMGRYLTSLRTRLQDAGLSSGVEVMRSGGGTFTAEVAADRPVETLLSGPAAGAWGAAAVARAVGLEDLISLDMGGTSADVTLVRGGRPRTTDDGRVGGIPFAVPTTDIHTVGSGGGSIAWVDDGGALRVGPRSAGAEPGPAAYGRGGADPTVTDADVVLGRLPPQVRLGGSMPLDRDRATSALAGLAERAGLDGPLAAAAGVRRVVEAQMVRALRVVSVEQGHDPREMTLVPFGGAGPLHQAALARELGCPRVLVPPVPGVLSALGLLAAPVTTDQVETRIRLLDELQAPRLRGWWDDLDERARSTLSAQGVEVDTVRHVAALRYRGQSHELEVEVAADDDPATLAGALHEAHAERYGYDQPDEPVELVTLRVRAEGPAQDLPLPRWEGGGPLSEATEGEVEVVDDDDEEVTARLVRRDRMAAGVELSGPAVVRSDDATVWIAGGQQARVGEHAELVVAEAD